MYKHSGVYFLNSHHVCPSDLKTNQQLLLLHINDYIDCLYIVFSAINFKSHITKCLLEAVVWSVNGRPNACTFRSVVHLTSILLVCVQVMNEITQHKINIYEFPSCYDEEENKITKKLKVLNFNVVHSS
jgi:hypothetical protein